MEIGPLSIRLLGPFEVRVGGQSMRSVRARSVEWLLALLVLRHGPKEGKFLNYRNSGVDFSRW